MKRNAGRVREWLVERALPLWATVGVDPLGGFVERLRWDGTPDLDAAKRIRVQARQIYVFSHAAVTGLYPDGVRLARRGFDFLQRHACPDGMEGGFVHLLDRHGTVLDARRDGYDHAFLLFAFSWLYRATGDADVKNGIAAVTSALDRRLTLPEGVGIAIDERHGTDRAQNPNMHLFEAMLVAAAATGDPRYLERADGLAALFRDRLFDAEAGILREHYDDRWRPAAGERGRIVEPGHHCEWIWLLKRHADSHGDPLPDQAWRLADFVDRHGRPDGSLLCDELWSDGTVKRAATRSWPQTEALKATVALAEARGDVPGEAAERIVDALFDRFLDRPVPGGWIDWLDADGQPLVDTIPASSFYHLHLAFAEYLAA